MPDAATILARVRHYGANIMLDGGNLRFVNKAKLPAEALPVIRQHAKAIAAYLEREGDAEERAAIMEHDGGVAKSETDRFVQLVMRGCPQAFDPADWTYFVSHIPEALEHARAA